MKKLVLAVLPAILAAVCSTSSVQAEEPTVLLFMPAILAAQSASLETNALYVSPQGKGDLCSRNAPCQLVTARDAIRRRNQNGGIQEDITVYLRGGTYMLSTSFQLTGDDSGTNGHWIHYSAYPGETPILSGGSPTGDWHLYNGSTGIYRSWIGTGVDFRQLYVNGSRAIRARGPVDPTGFIRSNDGFVAIDAAMQGWGNRNEIEIVGFNEWRNFRCRVNDIVGTTMTLQEPCWSNATGGYQPDAGFNSVSWVENAYELLDGEREWYLDRSGGYLYYKPGSAELLSPASSIFPRLQTLMQIGNGAARVRNISFSGISFAHTTWLGPASPTGYADLQAGFHLTGTSGSLAKTPAAVELVNGSGIIFNGNTFFHLGGAGLNIGGGSRQVEVLGNRFEDISSSAIQLGDITQHTTTTGNTVSHNVIIRAGQEYHDAVGIFVGYANSTLIEHNELRDLPYSGISVGWGWGASSYAASNRIRHNWIENIMHTLRDGGAIYTLSPQPDSEISFNYVCRQVNGYGGIYADEGTSGYHIHHNVLSHIGGAWLFHHNANYNTTEHNHSDNHYFVDQGTGNTIRSNTAVQAGGWSSEARSIINSAGVASPYRGSGMQTFCRSGATVLLVDDDDDHQESLAKMGYDDGLFHLNIPYDIWDTGESDVVPDNSILNAYDTVIWSMGYAEIDDAGIGHTGENSLKSWLNGGVGRRLLMSSHMYHALNWNSDLFRNYFALNIPSGYEDTTTLTSTGRLSGYGPFTVTPWVSRGDYTLALNPQGAETILRMNGTSVGTTRDGGHYQATYLAFPITIIDTTAKRTDLLGQILSW
jgi:hypothetical protein